MNNREQDILQAALDYANNQDIPLNKEFNRLLCIALGQAYKAGAEWADRTMIEKVTNWLKENADSYTWYDEFSGESGMMDCFIEEFKKATEE